MTDSTPTAVDRRAVLSSGGASALGIATLTLPAAAAAMSAPHAAAAESFRTTAYASTSLGAEEHWSAVAVASATKVVLGTDQGRLALGTRGAVGGSVTSVSVLTDAFADPFTSSTDAISGLAVAGDNLLISNTSGEVVMTSVADFGGGHIYTSVTAASGFAPGLLAPVGSRILRITDLTLVSEVLTPGGTPTIGGTTWRLTDATLGTTGFEATGPQVTCAAARGDVLLIGTVGTSGTGWLVRADLSAGAPTFSGIPLTLPNATAVQVQGIAIDSAGGRALVTVTSGSANPPRLSLLVVTLGAGGTMTLGGAEVLLAAGAFAGPTITDGSYAYVAESTGMVRNVHKVRMSDLLKVAVIDIANNRYLPSGTTGAAVADGTTGYFAATGTQNGGVNAWLMDVHTLQLDTPPA